MTDTSTQAPPPRSGPGAFDDTFGRLRTAGIHRDTDRRWFGGVCAGIAGRFDVDPLLIRAAAIALTIAGGFAIPVYLVLWLLLPDSRGTMLGERALRFGEGWPIVLAVVTGLALLAGLFSLVGFSESWTGPVWLLLPVGIVVWLLASRSGRPSVTAATSTTGLPSAVPPPPPPAGGSPMTAPTSPAAPTAPTAAPATPAVPAPAGRPPRYGEPGGDTPPWPSDSAPRSVAPGYPPQGPPAGGTIPPGYAPRPVGPPPPPRPRRRRPSGSVGLVSLGLAVLLLGLGVLVADPLGWPGAPVQLGFVLALLGVSVVVLGLGLSGRAAGVSGFLVLVLTAGTGIATLAAHSPAASAGERTWSPTDASLPATYELGAGDAELDLTGVTGSPPGGGDALREVQVDIGAGGLTIEVPDGLTVQVASEVGIGRVQRERVTEGAGRQQVGSPVDLRGTTHTVTVGTGTPDLVVEVDMGLGDITIIEES